MKTISNRLFGRSARMLVASVLMVSSVQCFAQQPSTICNDDGTVTFQYKNERAKEVMVDVQFAGRQKMERDAKTGVWSVTLGPAAPDMYPYCFVVDGVSVMDSLCEQYFPNEGFKNSLLEIPNRQGGLVHDIRAVPHGSVEYVSYYSKSLGATNHAVVYLPPSYWMNWEKKYPVFYLISGTTDTEEVYYKVGRVNYILDNLLAEGKAQDMIVVLPYGNPYKLLPTVPDVSKIPVTNFGGDVFSQDLVNDLMPFVERTYRTVNDRDHRAIGGFSRGGNQGLSCGLRNLDKFSYLCSYSSFTSTDIPDVYDHAADTNSKLHLFWLGVGTDDFLYGNARDYMAFLDQKGIRSVKEFTNDKFGHTWMNAKYFLDKTLRLLFNAEASEEAMRNGKPAPARTGQEPQFTPGVMARMFPKPIVSPEYDAQGGVTFRMKAPNAKAVALESELLPHAVEMKKDKEGVWSIRLTENVMETFKYCFVVDGMRVADANNMYLSPDRGFKYSIASNPASRYNFVSMGEMEHGRLWYNLNAGEAWYLAPLKGLVKNFIQLVPGADDTMESWFKLGGANAIADRLASEGKLKPCIMTTNDLKMVRENNGTMADCKVHTLRASDYKTWPERRKALEQLLLNLK